LGVIRPMLFETGSFSVNQRFPSGPLTIWLAEPEFEGMAYSVMLASRARRSSPSKRGLRPPLRRPCFGARVHHFQGSKRRRESASLIEVLHKRCGGIRYSVGGNT